jgi:DNA-binding HxlR family transcriptional regulator
MKLKKITTRPPHFRRRYVDACGAAHALELIGERWALLVIRELLLGPKRFSNLRADLPGISANILTQRLEQLEAAGVLTRRRLPPPAVTQVYELTPWGYESELSFRTMLDPARARSLDARIGFRLGAETYLAHIKKGRLDVARDDLKTADLIFIGTASALAAAVYGGQSLKTLTTQGALSLEGPRALAEKFVTLFPLPPKAEQPS